MKQISVADAALTGFRLASHQPKVLVIWSAFYIVMQLLVALGMVYMGGEALSEFMALSQTPNPDPAAVLALYGRVVPVYGVILLITIPFYTMAMTAAYRAVLRPAESSFGYLRLGADEARQFLVTLVLGILLFIAYFVAALVTVLVTGGVGAGLAAAGLPAALATVVSVLIAIPLFLAMWAPLAVKLSLAGPQTLAERRIRLFESWNLTRGHFWPMFGVYVIATVLAMVVTLLGLVIAVAFAAALGGGMQGLQSVMNPDMSSVAAYFSPLMIIYLLVMSIIGAMSLAITLTPPAAIYRDIAGPSSSDLADTFSD